MSSFTALGLGSTLLPGVVWAKMEEGGSPQVTLAILKSASMLAGLSFTDEELESILTLANQSLGRFSTLRKISIPNDVAPPFYFCASCGMVQKAMSSRLEGRLTLGDPLSLNGSRVARTQAKKADAEIAAGHYKGTLHGIPWGAKDIIAVKGYKTTWGSGAYQDQVIDEDATVIEMLRDAGAVLIAKLTTGELAGGDVWFGGRTNNPWNLDQGSSGSSAGPCSATASGCVAFAIGSETSGSILGPSARCGVTGLRPTFGRSSRYGVMALSWTQDRLGPLCRAVEDCAIVMNVISRPDGRDLSVSDIPFNWNAKLDFKKLRVGYLKEAFDENADRNPDWVKNEQRTLEQLRALGVKLIPVSAPNPYSEAVAIGETRVEAATFFDGLLRSGRDKLLSAKTRGPQFRSSRFIPAVEYLQSQRVRTMMMKSLADATAGVDVYLAPASGGAATPPGGAGRNTGAAAPEQPANLTQQHFQMANLACYPAVALPNGFAENGTPTSITFMARPFGEAELLALAKAYQDSTDYHLKHPSL